MRGVAVNIALISFRDENTELLISKVNKVAKDHQFNLVINNLNPTDKDKINENTHLILLVPKVRYEYLSFKKLANLLKIKVMVIDTIDFSALDGYAVFVKILQTIRDSLTK
ncbi:hypothetical protein [Mycoplasma sp. SG1]|uniref:hypothetical protein n=1 Tax=Mycoplasma sp. SG1 TaxID=2810348 RepID=UPI00202473B5|nr:hypothetical protein [Mycoplasma sp. SG1]URM53038.1 hypothetical protein JRW51_01685 [Mycoplasma sp. SG1]